jgi:hypothetical protein
VGRLIEGRRLSRDCHQHRSSDSLSNPGGWDESERGMILDNTEHILKAIGTAMQK